MDDYVAPVPLSVRTCSASGTKFFDLDADGVRDPGEPGLPRFLIWADYDNDGVRDSTEPFSVTDDDGEYVIDDIRPPTGSYRLRETLATTDRRRSTPSGWACSFPNATTAGGSANGPGGLFGCGWGPITTASTPHATRRDFGDWVPASLTIEKQLWPADDPGRVPELPVVLPDRGRFDVRGVHRLHGWCEVDGGRREFADCRLEEVPRCALGR